MPVLFFLSIKPSLVHVEDLRCLLPEVPPGDYAIVCLAVSYFVEAPPGDERDHQIGCGLCLIAIITGWYH